MENPYTVFELLKKRIDANIPTALLRYGDGEGAFCIHRSNFRNTYYFNACHKHWGEVPRLNERYRIAANIKNSFLKADIVGISPPERNGNWLKSREYFLKLIDKQVITTIDIHIYLNDGGFLNELIRGKDVFYLSCRNVDETILKKYGARSVKRLLVSPQYKFECKKPQIPFYKDVISIEDKLKTLNLKGKICLLGAGVAGKQLGIVMKQRGGFVIDIGSVFDLWEGKITRSWIKKYM